MYGSYDDPQEPTPQGTAQPSQEDTRSSEGTQPKESQDEEVEYQSIRPSRREGESFGMISVGLFGGGSKAGQIVTRSDKPDTKQDE